MNYQEIAPSAMLAKLVKCYWVLEDLTPSTERPAERIVPDGCMELVINLGDAFKGYRDGIVELRPSVLLVGEVRRHVIVHPAERVHLFGVRFHPGGVYPFFSFPANEVADMMVDLENVWGEFAHEIEERINEARTTAERVRRLEGMLIARLDGDRANDRIVEMGVHMIIGQGGQIAVSALADRLGISERQFERRFRRAVGVGPKSLARVTRFQRIFRAFEAQGIRKTWAEIALECGYYDQAHFIHDFIEFAGQSPASYFGEYHGMADHFVGGLSIADFGFDH